MEVGVGVGVEVGTSDDIEYNRRKDTANSVFFTTFQQLVAGKDGVRALLLDAPPRGLVNKKPNTADFLVHKKGVPPSNIAVVNPCPFIAETLEDMDVRAYRTTFNDFLMHHRPDSRFNYLYLDACGSYRKQLRSGIRTLLQNHDRWLCATALMSVVVCKRSGKKDLDLVKKDLHKWSKQYEYGNVLMMLAVPTNPKMHTATFLLKRNV